MPTYYRNWRREEHIEKGAQHPRERKKSRNSNKIQKLALSKSFPHKALGTKMENTNTEFKNRDTLYGELDMST